MSEHHAGVGIHDVLGARHMRVTLRHGAEEANHVGPFPDALVWACGWLAERARSRSAELVRQCVAGLLRECRAQPRRDPRWGVQGENVACRVEWIARTPPREEG